MQGKIPFETTLPSRKMTYSVGRSVERMLKMPKIDCQPHMSGVPKFKIYANLGEVKNMRASGVHEKPRTNATTNRGNGELLPMVSDW